MNQAQAVAHALLVEHLQCFKQFGTGQAELRGIAAALFPFSAATGSQFDTDTDVRTYVQLLSHAGDDIQLVQFLHHDEDLLTHLLCQQRQFDIALVLVTITYDDRVALTLYGDDGMQLGLGTSLYTQVELTSVRDDLFNNRLHLVHLDGIDHVVLTLVIIFLGCFLETAPGLLDTVVQDIGETQQYRGCHIAQRQFIHHLAQVNLRLVLAGRHIDITLVVDTKVTRAPSVDVVQLAGII